MGVNCGGNMKGWYGNSQKHSLASKGVRTRQQRKEAMNKFGEADATERARSLNRHLDMLKHNPNAINWDEVDEIYASMGIEKDSIEDYAMDILTRLHIGRFEDASEIYREFIKVYGKDKVDDLNYVMDKLNETNKKLDVNELDKKIMMNYYEGKRKMKSKGLNNIQTIFQYHHDAGHGWLKVPKDLLQKLGIEKEITPYSYVKGNDVYLEEDVDASIFFNAYEDIYGQKPKITEYYDGDESIIRDYRPYRKR